MLMDRILEGLKLDEGFRSFPYRCTANKLTIGYGRNLEERGITKEEATHLLKNDIREVLYDLQQIFRDYDIYPESVQYVLANMRFQLGSGGFRNFKNMIAAIKRENWQQAAIEMINSKWYRQTTKRANRLVDIMKGVK